jgi:glycosyltransferase involved in cell wall biosynthesis
LLPVQKAFTKVDGIVTVSEYERDYAIEKGYQTETHVAAIDNPLPDEFLNQRVLLEREPVIGYCGSWLARKGSKIIEAELPHILEEFQNYRLQLIGVGPGFRKEEHFPRALLSRIEVIPFVEDKNGLRQLYHTIPILITPSIHESFGLVTAEGMACGCAVIAGNTGFAKSLRNGEEALVFDPGKSGALYESIKRLVADDSLRQQLAKAGHARVQSLRWSAAVKRLEGIYQSWLGELRGDRGRGEPGT